MQVSLNHDYQKSVDEVFAFFSDADKVVAKFEAIGARNVKVLEHQDTENGLMVRIQREVPADVPGLLKKFLNPWNTITQQEKWEQREDGSRFCHIEVSAAGVPVQIQGTLHTKPTEGGCVNEVRLNVSCAIPFVGGKLADFVANDTRKAAEAEYAYIAGQ